MRNLLSLLILFFLCVAGRAGQLITATITVTNTPSDSDTITVNGSTRTWKTTVATPSTQILIGAAIGAHATNMWTQFATYRISTLTPGFPATNQVTLRGIVDQTLTLSIAGTWGYYALSTNTTSDGEEVIVPGSSLATQSTATNIISLLALDLGTYSTNKLANSTKLLEGVVQTNGTQVVNGDKHFTGATVLSNTGNQIIHGAITNVHLGASNAWIWNTVLYGTLLITNTSPKIVWFDSNATSDNGTIEWTGQNGDIAWTFYNDAGSSFSTAFAINRTGSTIDSVQLPDGERQIGGSGSGNEVLRVTGSTRFDRVDITTLSSSNNAAIDLENRTFARITSGPTNAFNINGIEGGANGKMVILYNSTAYQMTIYNDSGIDPTPANRIYTLVGSNIVCTAAILAYDSGASRWIVVATPSITDVTGSGGSGSYQTIAGMNSTDAVIPIRQSEGIYVNSNISLDGSSNIVVTPNAGGYFRVAHPLASHILADYINLFQITGIASTPLDYGAALYNVFTPTNAGSIQNSPSHWLSTLSWNTTSNATQEVQAGYVLEPSAANPVAGTLAFYKKIGTGSDTLFAKIALDSGYVGSGAKALFDDGTYKTVTPSGSRVAALPVALSDLTTAITAGTSKAYFRMPFAMTLTSVRCALLTAQATGSTFTVDVNEAGSTVLSTKLTIDNTEKTSTTAAAAAVISDSSLADDAEITFDIDTVGDGTAVGCTCWLLGTY